MDTSRGWATSAPSTDDIHLKISFCLRRSVSGITSHVTRSGALAQNDSYSLFRVKNQQQQGEQEFGDYEAVLQFVEDVILQQKTVLSMNKLHEISKLHPDDTRYRHMLKLRLKETFSEKIMFFQPNKRYPDVVIARDSIEEVLTTITHPQTCIKSAAATL